MLKKLFELFDFSCLAKAVNYKNPIATPLKALQ